MTHLLGQRLHGMTMGVRTELAVAKSVDKGDLDELAIHPLPIQERIVDAFAAHGFRCNGAGLEQGLLPGVRQEFPFHQQIRFHPPQHYAAAFHDVELTFVADPVGVDVLLEFDKRGRFVTPGHDTYARFRVPHTDADLTDWPTRINSWVQGAAGHYQAALQAGHGTSYGVPGYGVPGYGVPGHGVGGYDPGYGVAAYDQYPGDHGHHDERARRRGPGFGAVAAGVAGGVVGGMVLGEVVEEFFEDDSEDPGE